MLILSREDKWDHPTAHSPHLHLLLVTIFTSLMEGGCHCCGWIRIWLLTMIYEVLKWIFKWVEKVLVPSWNHKHKCSLLPQKCFSACNISLLLDSKDVFIPTKRKKISPDSVISAAFVAVLLLPMCSCWWCDSKLCPQTLQLQNILCKFKTQNWLRSRKVSKLLPLSSFYFSVGSGVTIDWNILILKHFNEPGESNSK